MKQYVALDCSLKLISVCVMTEQRRIVTQAFSRPPPRRNSPRARHGLRWQIGPMGGSADGAGSSPDSLVEEAGFELLVPQINPARRC
jgi:hypothetical protein